MNLKVIAFLQCVIVFSATYPSVVRSLKADDLALLNLMDTQTAHRPTAGLEITLGWAAASAGSMGDFDDQHAIP
ncbi:hypothetical protein [Nonomuraea sp. NPDC048916]|uniref:hypothetical protein n=1 Tax=Nonomuraea sp. NPDC048916 TaxID=3154232 RepID=UPI0033C31769